MDTYEKHANLYSAWTAMAVPFVLAIYVLLSINMLFDVATWIKWLSTLVISSVCFASIGYYSREVFRTTSKLLFQTWLFKEDATKMPTTELLLWKNRLLSEAQLANIRRKVKKDFHYDMMNAEQEAADEQEARLNIRDVVGMIRKHTKVDVILLQANYRYGFCRNLLGGLVWAFAAVFVFAIYNCFAPVVCSTLPFACVLAIMLQGVFDFYAMKYCARDYAKHLIESYANQKE